MRKREKCIIPLLAAALLWPTGQTQAAAWQDEIYDSHGLEVYGFVEGRAGWRLQEDTVERQSSIGEARGQLVVGKDLGWGVAKLKADLSGDLVEDELRAELREANLLFSPADMVDLKLGRQTLTWGTGDLIFINDMFPKDWQSFFIGRDDEYLKAPSDAIKASLFFEAFDLDLVLTPVFNGSDFVSGERLSFYNSLAGGYVGQDNKMIDQERTTLFRDSEVSMRLSRQFGSMETALYGYSGFWKEPEGIDLASGEARYPRLSVYGGSVRTAMLGGVVNLEAGYYDSRENGDGDDWSGRNSEVRLLAGFERELGQDLTGAFQYYLEWMQDYGDYEAALPSGLPERDQYRHLLTTRLTKLLVNQTLTLSLFCYWSPSDEDGYCRPKAKYKLDDHWLAEVGGNMFWGEEDHTFWARFKKNSNVYTALRYSF